MLSFLSWGGKGCYVSSSPLLLRFLIFTTFLHSLQFAVCAMRRFGWVHLANFDRDETDEEICINLLCSIHLASDIAGMEKIKNSNYCAEGSGTYQNAMRSRLRFTMIRRAEAR